jgi:hypothetical protein
MNYCSSVVGIATRIRAAGGGVQMHIMARDILVETSRPALGLTQRVPRALALEVERLDVRFWRLRRT